MRVRSGACLLLVVVFSTTAWSFEFSAQRIARDQGKVVNAQVNARDDRWRFEYSEPQSGAMAAIVSQDRQVVWRILSKHRMYQEVSIVREHLLLVSEKMDGEVSRELIGTEDLNGYPTEMFDVTVMAKGEPQRYYHVGHPNPAVSDQDGQRPGRLVGRIPQCDLCHAIRPVL